MHKRTPNRAAPLVYGLAMVCALACETKQTEPPENTGPAAMAPAPRDSDADAAESLAIADAIDPGELAPLSGVLPEWVRTAVGVPESLPGDRSTLLRATQEAMAAFRTSADSGKGTGALMQAVMAVARAAVLAELAAARGEAGAEELAMLARVYQAIDIPLLANERNLFAQLLQVFVAAAKTEGHTDDADAAQKLADSVFTAVRRAGPLHRRTVARLLRSDPHHAGVPQALLDVGAALQGKDDALAIRAGELAVRLGGDAITVKQLLALADLCHYALQAECGGRALAKARALASQTSTNDDDNDDNDAKWIAESTTAAKLAERVIALDGVQGLEPRLERAVGLMELKRPEEGRAVFEALRREFPGDARPVGGLARHAIDTRLDLAGASQIIDGAGVLANGDAAYYELAIGTRATAMLSSVLPVAMSGDWAQANHMLVPVIARMEVDVRAYEALGYSDGRFLRFVFTLVNEAVPLAQRGDNAALTAMMRDMLPRAVAIVEEIDDNPHAYRLMLSATQFSRDKNAALRAASRPAPTGASHDALTVRRVQGLVDLAVTWNDPDIAAALETAIAQGGADFEPSAAGVIADARAVAARLAGRPLGPEVVAAYEAVMGDPAESTSAQALNNLAVARAEAGDLAGAVPLWERAAGLSDGWSEVATLNLAIKRPQPDATAALRRLADDGSSVAIRLAAQAWLVSLAADAPARRKATRALATAARKESRDHVRPVLLPKAAGVVLEGTLNAGLGYATKAGLSIELDTAGIPWLTFAPPTPIVDPR